MKRILTILAVLSMLLTPVHASNIVKQQAAMLETDRLSQSLPNDAQTFMDGISPETQGDFGDSIRRILSAAVLESKGVIRNAGNTAFTMLAIVIICVIVIGVVPKGAHWACTLAGALAMGLCCAGDIKSMIGLGERTVEELASFCKILIPTLGAATAATGALTASAALQAGAIFFFQILTSFICGFLVPVVYGYLALTIAGCAQENPAIDRLKKLIGDFIKKCLRVMLLIFSSFLSITGVISGSADAISVKTAKMAVSSAVPVVGSMVADASETVLVSAKLLRNSVGIYGMLAALSIMIMPFLKLAIHYLVLQFTEVLCIAVGGKAHANLVGAFTSVMGYLLAMVACSGLLAFVSCVCFMKVATS